jgi:hypothetical protein
MIKGLSDTSEKLAALVKVIAEAEIDESAPVPMAVAQALDECGGMLTGMASQFGGTPEEMAAAAENPDQPEAEVEVEIEDEQKAAPPPADGEEEDVEKAAAKARSCKFNRKTFRKARAAVNKIDAIVGASTRKASAPTTRLRMSLVRTALEALTTLQSELGPAAPAPAPASAPAPAVAPPVQTEKSAGGDEVVARFDELITATREVNARLDALDTWKRDVEATVAKASSVATSATAIIAKMATVTESNQSGEREPTMVEKSARVAWPADLSAEIAKRKQQQRSAATGGRRGT